MIMTQEEKEQFKVELKELVTLSIKETVNGKIDRMHQELREHAKIDEGNALILNDFIKADKTWKDNADPYIRLAANIAGTWTFAVYVLTGILVALGIWKYLK